MIALCDEDEIPKNEKEVCPKCPKITECINSECLKCIHLFDWKICEFCEGDNFEKGSNIFTEKYGKEKVEFT
jgi:hypothetical protein